MAIDSDWFKRRIAESAYPTLRKVAPEIGIHYTEVSRLIQGKRRLQLNEAQALARILGLPLQEILARAGVKEAKPKAQEPFPSMPSDIRQALSRTPKDDPLWELIRVALKLKRR